MVQRFWLILALWITAMAPVAAQPVPTHPDDVLTANFAVRVNGQVISRPGLVLESGKPVRLMPVPGTDLTLLVTATRLPLPDDAQKTGKREKGAKVTISMPPQPGTLPGTEAPPPEPVTVTYGEKATIPVSLTGQPVTGHGQRIYSMSIDLVLAPLGGPPIPELGPDGRPLPRS